MPAGGRGFAAAVWLCAATLYGQSVGSFAGVKRCAPCHPTQSATHAQSAHASALHPAAEHPLKSAFASESKLTRQPGYRFEFQTAVAPFRVRIFDNADVMDLPMEWAFGAGRQAVTFVTRVNKDWYVEHYASFYPALRAFGPTPGQEAVRPKSLAEAAGVIYKIADPDTGIASCFECHSTGPVSFGADGEAKLTERGVRCEACHGGGGDHVVDPKKNPLRNPGRMTATAINTLCGRCHRPPAAKGVQIDWSYAWNVRHQPVYLNESQCFQKSDGRLSCLTCHDPHEAAARKPLAHYNRRCTTCHSETERTPKAICLAEKPANCVDCHMPLVSPQSPLRFANHWIGIYGSGSKLKPRR